MRLKKKKYADAHKSQMTKRGDVGGLTGQTIIVWVAATVFHKHKQYRKKKEVKKKKSET